MKTAKNYKFFRFAIGKQLLIVLMIVMLVGMVYAQPPTFHQFYGNVKCYDGSNVDNNILRGIVSGKQSTNPIMQGIYGYNPLFIVEDGINGHTILFKINDTEIGRYIFEDTSTTNLNFEVNNSICFVPENPDDEFLGLLFKIIIFGMLIALVIVMTWNIIKKKW